MASFPGSKVRYPGNRRKLGRGQQPPRPAASLTVTVLTSTSMKIIADQPVVWDPAIAATVATRTIVSQTEVSPTEVHILFSGALAGLAYTVPGGAGATFMGGVTLPASGTF